MFSGIMSTQANPAPLVLIGVPSDANSSYVKGCSGAPAEIRKALASDSAHLVSEAGIDIGREGLIEDVGDIEVGPDGQDFDAIEAALSPYLALGQRVISMGGDHAITHPLVRAHARVYPKLSILHFDAHPDTYELFEDNPRSHASPFARIMEAGLVTRLVQVGIRTLNPHLREQAERFGIETIEMRHFERAMGLNFEDPLYISFDLDALDPSCAPGVSHWEPGGASTRQVLDVLHSLQAQVVGADVVELNPTRDRDGFTAMTAGRVLREIAAKMVASLPE